MFLDLENVFLEDESSVGFFLSSPVSSVLTLPVSEGISFLFLSVEEDQEGNGGQSGNDEFFSHNKSLYVEDYLSHISTDDSPIKYQHLKVTI